MLPEARTNMKNVFQIAFKELKLFFSSPIGYLFLGVFVAATLFIFFWGESYFARNIADVRPMFEWMPILLIFLSAALTMRMWSEERRSGTLEHVLTLPVPTWHFVQGKFAACKMLLALSLLLTLPLPITVSMIGNLDWGPVISGYIATMLLGSAYLAIGLYVSARSDNQIVSLILTVLLCGIFYMLGSGMFHSFFGNQTVEALRSLGTGSRFESITRGVLDIRDFYYYITIASVFLVLNRYSLESSRWAEDGDIKTHTRWRLTTGLVLANIIAFNFVLAPLAWLRLDTTQGKIYSISEATHGYLNQLQEPLLIRGYFSAKTHPLLAPLVPEVKDLLKEYAAKSKGQVRVEIIDPATNPEAEEEAGSKYGIKPVPFRVDDRYQSTLVNSYFNILVLYGDEYKVVNFDEMIEVKARSEDDIDVRLRNPEYDITNAIKQVLYAYQAGGNLFDSIQTPVTFSAYVSSPQQLPESLAEFQPALLASLQKAQQEADGKFSFEFIDPMANGGAAAKEIEENYGFQPMISSLFDSEPFYYYLVLSNDTIAVQVSLPEDLTEEAFDRVLDAGLKRFASGFTKTVGFAPPPPIPPFAAQMGAPQPASFTTLEAAVNQSMTASNPKLSEGRVSDDADLLMVMAPEKLDEKSVFAIDQYLMKGGTVVMATSPYRAKINETGLSAEDYPSGVEDWLKHHGITIGDSLIMDPQSSAFPVPVTRQVGMYSVQEMQQLAYPYFAELRENALNQSNPITSGLVQLTMPWASPIVLDEEKNAAREIIKLAETSPGSWLSNEMDISPRVNPDGSHGFQIGNAKGSQLVAAVITGRFDSFFAGKESPLLKQEEQETAEGEEAKEPEEVISSIIEHSPESARLIVISSNAFAEDTVLRMMSALTGNQYVSPLEMMINIADWSLDDGGLVNMRTRGHFNRTLPPMDDDQRQFWELLNYGLAIIGLILVYLFVLWRQRARRASHLQLLASLAKGKNAVEQGAKA